MKLILLAAAAFIAVPALAQTTPNPAMQAPPADAAPATQQSMPAPAAPMPGTTGADPVGGYQPAQAPMSGPAQPGATVRFQPAPTPDQAYPAPAALASYPICKRGQFDKCREPASRRLLQHYPR